jgi:hypothetical protein
MIRQFQAMRGNVVRVEDDGDVAVLYYDNDGMMDKYILRVIPDIKGAQHGMVVPFLAFEKLPAPYGVYLTNSKGEPGKLLGTLFEFELEEFISKWQGGIEWIERIKNGDRFYGGISTNKAVVTKRVDLGNVIDIYI